MTDTTPTPSNSEYPFSSIMLELLQLPQLPLVRVTTRVTPGMPDELTAADLAYLMERNPIATPSIESAFVARGPTSAILVW